MKWRQIIPTAVTLAAMLSGFLSIIVTFQAAMVKTAGSMEDGVPDWCTFATAAKLIMLAMILDGIDGNLARWLKGTSDFGAELDTYVDMTAFGLAPAILIFAVSFQQTDPLWRVLLPSAVCVSGVVRLARFKVKDPLRGQGGYAGLPITANAAWVALFVVLSQTPEHERFSLDKGIIAVVFLVGIVVFITLQVTNLRYPKPTKNVVLFTICIILVVLLLALAKRQAVVVSLVMLTLGLVYVIIGPLFVKTVEAHKARKNALNGQNGSDQPGNGNLDGV